VSASRQRCRLAETEWPAPRELLSTGERAVSRVHPRKTVAAITGGRVATSLVSQKHHRRFTSTARTLVTVD